MNEAKRGYEVEDLLRLKSVGDPQISPDGDKVAYVIGEIDREDDGYRSSIWLVSTGSGESQRLTYGGKNDAQPRWSPNGAMLAFVSDREGARPQLYVLPTDGGEARKLTDLSRGVSDPAWSPDSSRLAFLSRTGGPDTGKDKPKTAPPIVVTNLKHKANGQGFFDGSHPHVFVIPLQRDEQSRDQPAEPLQITDGDWDDAQIAWSPDGSQIVFVSARHAGRDRDEALDIWSVPAAGGETRPLTDHFGPCSSPVFSPDGRSLAFSGHRHPLELGERVSSLWIMPASGGEPRNLTSALDRSLKAGAPQAAMPQAPLKWLAEGSSVLGLVEDRASIHLDRFSAADGAATRLIGGERCLNSFSAARDGRIACTISDLQHPAEVYLVGSNGSGERRLTGVNDEAMAGLRLPETEDIRFRMPDGAEIEGWVFKPLVVRVGQQYPLVLDIHGGPHGAFMRTFRGSYVHALTSRGCAVLQLNPRGSTGWGEAFAGYLRGGWGGDRDLPEFLAGVDHLIEQGWVDPERLGITGYSYGGILTNYAIGHCDRFKAAVSGAGAANVISHFAYSDITTPRFRELDGPPWERLERYLEVSAISSVQQINTPLLLLHGDDDLRVNISQAEEFFTALKYYDREVVLVRYPGQNHMMRANGKPSYRVDYDQRVVDWFSKYLALSRAEEREAVASR